VSIWDGSDQGSGVCDLSISLFHLRPDTFLGFAAERQACTK